jgi:protocatechuate 3,4-dioxygenase beta subunit
LSRVGAKGAKRGRNEKNRLPSLLSFAPSRFEFLSERRLDAGGAGAKLTSWQVRQVRRRRAMQRPRFSQLPRRSFLATSVATVAVAAAAAFGWLRRDSVAGMVTGSSTEPRVLAPTPACGDNDGHDTTAAQTEGPYFTPNSPERASLLEPGMAGTRLVVSGSVFATDCTPVSRALLDFWQADDAGVYDNSGYRLRGHQYSDDAGRFSLETVIPGLYPGRTRHIHVKVQSPNGPVLTTQLYFPNEPGNARDGIFDASLLMDIQDDANAKQGTFTFVINT